MVNEQEENIFLKKQETGSIHNDDKLFHWKWDNNECKTRVLKVLIRN